MIPKVDWRTNTFIFILYPMSGELNVFTGFMHSEVTLFAAKLLAEFDFDILGLITPGTLP